MTNTDGGDAPEDAIYASMKAVNDTTWREDSQKFIVLVTDAGTKERPSITVGGQPVTATGLADLTNSKNIDISIQTVRYNGSSTYSNEVGVNAITMDKLCSVLGVKNNFSTNEPDILNNLSISISDDNQKSWHYSYTINSVYEDGSPSTDVSVSINPKDFTLVGDDNNMFNISAVASDSPKLNSKTTVTITFLCDGVPVNNGVNATQTLTLTVPVNDVTKIPVNFVSNGGSSVPSQSVNKNEKAIRPSDPTRDGYFFNGWYSDDLLTELYNFDGPITVETTLYAKWSKNNNETINTADSSATITKTANPTTPINSETTGKSLPNTGEKNSPLLTVIGAMILLASGVYILTLRRKRSN